MLKHTLGHGADISVSPASPSARGFSLIELAVVVTIISILMVAAISRLMALHVDAERVAMENIVGTLRSAIGIKVAEYLSKQDLRNLGTLEGSNPMDRLAELPSNYLGALDGADPKALDDGNWYFDKRDGTLVYLVRNKAFFQGGLTDPPRARFAIQFVYTERNGNARMIEGVRLAVREPYKWTTQQTQ